MSSWKDQEKRSDIKRSRDGFLLLSLTALSFSLFLARLFICSLSLYIYLSRFWFPPSHVIIIFLRAFLGRSPRHFSLGGFSHDWWAFVTILRSQSLSSLLHDGMPATSYCVSYPSSTPTALAHVASVRETGEKLLTLWWAAGGNNKETRSETQRREFSLRLWKTATTMVEHLSSMEWNWKFHPLRTGISQLAFSR